MLRRWAPFLGPLLVVLAYARALGAPFVWDDRRLIVDSARVTTLRPIATYFGGAFWRNPGAADQRTYYRPLTILSFALDHVAHGDNPAGFHLTNVLLHALNVGLLYLLLRRYRIGAGVAVALASLWGLQPRLTEAVAWVSGRTDVLATTFVLAALLLYRPHRAGRMLVASLLVLLGLFAKEVALAGAIALVALELVVADGVLLRRRVPLAAVPVIAVLGFLAARWAALHLLTARPLEVGPTERGLLALATLGEYARVLVSPWTPELQIGMSTAPGVLYIAIGAGTALAAGVLAYRARRFWLGASGPSACLVVMGSALGGVGIGLVLHIVPLAVNVLAADRFLYLPTAGLALALARSVDAWRMPAARKAALAAVLASTFFVATFVRVGDWCSEIDLWLKAYRETPASNSVPLNEIGAIYYREGLFAQAAAIYARQTRIARDHDRERELARANYANVLGELGDYGAAARGLEELCDEDREVAHTCYAAGVEELRLFHFDEARELLRRALQRTRGDFPAAASVLGLVERVEALTLAPAFTSTDPWLRSVATVEVDRLVGRRQEALRLSEAILLTPGAPRAARVEGAVFWARLGPPGEASGVLARPEASDVVEPSMLEVANERASIAGRLVAAFGELGVER